MPFSTGSNSGAADVSAAVQAELNAGRDVWISDNYTWRFDNFVTVPAGQKLFGPGKIVLQAGTSAGITLQNGARLLGVTIAASGTGYTGSCVNLPAGTSGQVVDGCEIVTTGASTTAIQCLSDVATQTFVSDATIRGNVIKAAANANHQVMLRGALRVRVDGNTVDGGGWGIYGHNFRRCSIVNNTARNQTFVGIGSLSQRKFNPYVNIGNVISGNNVYNAGEESISLDCTANVPADWNENGALPVGTVSSATDISTSQTRITLQETVSVSGVEPASTTTNWANGFMAIVLSGMHAGTCALIEECTATTITVSRSAGFDATGLASGTKILITLPYIGNIISNNTVNSTILGCWGIRLYGSAWHNIITDNTVQTYRPPVSVTSLVDAVLGTTGSWRPTSWSGFNTIASNFAYQHRDASEANYGPIYSEIFGTLNIPAGEIPWESVAYLPKQWNHMRQVVSGNHVPGTTRAFFQGNRAIINDNVFAGSNGIRVNNSTQNRLALNVNATTNNVGIRESEGTGGSHRVLVNATRGIVTGNDYGT